ncbi:hypothetical protein JYU34_014091 [Plutella xylostella]|uniref:PAW domain-containing protein n=1 Tax=Plutella xylostella TaxID=51655 RepID=A0ABQ7Q7K0_PLUXY|nr:hypothetical protein JYU34_014091 [Plutella xylostella]
MCSPEQWRQSYLSTIVTKLESALEAIEKKLHYSGVVTVVVEADSASQLPAPTKKRKLEPLNLLVSSNEFLSSIEANFNDVLMYEEEEAQKLARSHIPLETLQIQAMGRMREHQRKIKSDGAALELVGWFKGSFFSWVDRPDCGGAPEPAGVAVMKTDEKTCRVEILAARMFYVVLFYVLPSPEGASSGSLSWRVSAKTGVVRSLTVNASAKLYETGAVRWNLSCDGASPASCRLATLTASLPGGRGDVGWQHSQLFRQALDDRTAAMEIRVDVEETSD